MATALKKDLVHLQKKVARFARQYIAGRDDLHSMNGFPHDIWDKMGNEKLLGISLPEEYEGLGGDYLSIVVAGEALTRTGHNMGIAISWLIHNAVSRFIIMGFGDKRQYDIYLKGLATGKITASIAVSEPGRGAHPKYLETSAYRRGDFYMLTGEKSYLTNGPIADLFIVVASTEVDGERKRFTAFIVPKDTTGLSMTEPIKLDFFRPAPHGGIVLSQCSIPASSIIGEEGSAYEKMIKPFREVEDALMMGLLVGGMARQFDLLLNLIGNQGVDPQEELKKCMGEMQSTLHALRIMAYEAASMLDSSIEHIEFLPLLISFRNILQQSNNLFKVIISMAGIEEDTDLHRITNDMAHSMDMAKNVNLIKQKKIGKRLLTEKGSDEFAP